MTTMNSFMNDLLRSHHSRRSLCECEDDDSHHEMCEKSCTDSKIVVCLVDDNARRHSSSSIGSRCCSLAKMKNCWMPSMESLERESQNLQTVSFTPGSSERSPVATILCEVALASTLYPSVMEAESPTSSLVSNSNETFPAKRAVHLPTESKKIRQDTSSAHTKILPTAKYTPAHNMNIPADASLKSLTKSTSFLLNRNALISEHGDGHLSDESSTSRSLESAKSFLDAAILVGMKGIKPAK